jgi:3-phosphoshikimate 1-carboxyvinyltransferase
VSRAGAREAGPPLRLLGAALAAATAARPDAPAVVEVGTHGDRSWSWRQLTDATAAARAELHQLGVGPGDTVAYQLANRLEFVALTLAIVEQGATCMPLMPIFRERELEFMLAEAQPRVLYVPDTFRGHDHLGMARGIAPHVAALAEIVAIPDEARGAGWSTSASSVGVVSQTSPTATDATDTTATDAADTTATGTTATDTTATDATATTDTRATATATSQATPDQLVDLLFTSGSTGEPKGALHRHDRLMTAAARHQNHFGLTREDVIFCPAPLAHQTGFLYGMWLALTLGATLVVQEIWDGATGFEAIQRHNVSFVQVATPFLADLVAEAEQRHATPDSLKVFVATGAAVPRELARRARTVLGADVGGGFGSTETCMAAAFVPGTDPDRAAETDGRAMAGVSLRVVDDAGHPLPPGSEGNFEIATDMRFSGYLNRPELTAAALTADGFYRTGDLARIDADGYLRITGRVKDQVNRGGEKVPVGEVEQLMYGIPGVAEVAIVAMPDPRLVERACAFVVLEASREELELAEVQDHLAGARLAKPYWPERIEVVEALPRTPSGKIQKFVLREQAAALVQEDKVVTR